METTDVAIIGAGPAGIGAAIQLHRYGVDPVVLERTRIGGLLVNAGWVENYPGFHEGISGERLAGLMEAHLGRHKPRVLFEEVLRVGQDGGGFIVECPEGAISARAVIVASGTKPRPVESLEIPPGARERVVYEIYPIMAARDRRIVIVGGGDVALDYALSLGRQNDVMILTRGSMPRCLPLLWERAKAAPRITLQTGVEIAGIEAGTTGELALHCAGPEETLQLRADHLIFAIGRVPDCAFLSDGLAAGIEQGQLPRGLHLVGDVCRGSMRQTAIAIGDGVMAAMRTQEMLRETAQ